MQFIGYNTEEPCYKFHHVIDKIDCACLVRVPQGQQVKKGLLEKKVTRSVSLSLNFIFKKHRRIIRNNVLLKTN